MAMAEFKQVIVARTDLKMGKGKLAAQVAHAALASAEESRRRNEEWYDEWKMQGQAMWSSGVTGRRSFRNSRRRRGAWGSPQHSYRTGV